MENKYFTPDIENLCIGYECEINNTHGKWESITITFTNSNSFYKTDLAEVCLLVEDKYIRVPYLTKEQIEAEGWKHDERYDDVKHFYINELHLTLYIGYLKEEIIYHHISIFHGGGIMFRGECKDINTFRKIIKLLKI
jgi:hypothetical protein